MFEDEEPRESPPSSEGMDEEETQPEMDKSSQSIEEESLQIPDDLDKNIEVGGNPEH